VELSLDDARAVLAAQPFSRLLGASITALGPEGVELLVPNRPDHRQQDGFAHGGLLGYAADNALAFAAGLVAGPRVLTAGYTISLLAPVVGQELVARARTVSAGRRLLVTRCEIVEPGSDGERLCAVAQGTVVRTGSP
jgi:uncharacterized protein (TIGR00369 family)